MQVNVIIQNVATGALSYEEGIPRDRWPLLVERIGGAADRVDVVMLCEVAGWELHGHDRLIRAARDLDLDWMPLPPARSGNGTALLYRRELLGRPVRWLPDVTLELRHGFAVTSFEVGLPAPLSFVPVHFTPFSAEQALIEANIAATRGYAYGPYAVLGGDVNYPPAASSSPPPDFAAMKPYNLGSRTLLPDDETPPGSAPVPDRRVTRKLVHNGYVDVAGHLYQKTKDPALLAATGTDDRVDQGWVSAALAEAVSDYRRLTTPVGASDHHGLRFVLDTDAIQTSNRWTYR